MNRGSQSEQVTERAGQSAAREQQGADCRKSFPTFGGWVGVPSTLACCECGTAVALASWVLGKRTHPLSRKRAARSLA